MEEVKDKIVSLEDLQVAYDAHNSRLVTLESGGGVTEEQVRNAVDNYVSEHGLTTGATAEQAAQIQQNAAAVTDLKSDLSQLSEEIGNGLSATARSLLIIILRNGVYNTDQSANITALENALNGSGESGGGTGTETATYTVTNTLSNVITNNAAASVIANESYTATLTPADGYTLNNVSVLMGGVDVTASVYSDGTISIASVTGDVVITASAVGAVSGGDIITIGGELYDISSASDYGYKMVISTKSGYFLYGANEPFYISIRSDGTTHNEVYPAGTVRGQESNNAFPELTAYSTSSDYTFSATARTADDFVYTNHDLVDYNDRTIVRIPASE